MHKSDTVNELPVHKFIPVFVKTEQNGLRSHVCEIWNQDSAEQVRFSLQSHNLFI